MTRTVARRVARARSRRRSVGRARHACSATSAPTSCASCRPTGDPLGGNIARAWNAGKQVVALAADDAALDALLADADVVFDEIGAAGNASARSARARRTRCGCASPVRRRRPARRLDRVRSRRDGRVGEHVLHRRSRPRADPLAPSPPATRTPGPEAAFAAMTALASGLPQRVDLSMQEVVLVANMAAPRAFPETGAAAAGAAPTSAARARSGRPSTASSRSGCAAARRASRASRSSPSSSPATACPPTRSSNRDWNDFNQNTATDEDLAAIETAVAAVLRRPHDAGALRHRGRDAT